MPASARLALMSPRPRNPSRHLAKPPGASCLSLPQLSQPVVQTATVLLPTLPWYILLRQTPRQRSPTPTKPTTAHAPARAAAATSARPTPDANERPSLSNHVGSLRARKVRPQPSSLPSSPHRTAQPHIPQLRSLPHTPTAIPPRLGEAHSAASHHIASAPHSPTPRSTTPAPPPCRKSHTHSAERKDMQVKLREPHANRRAQQAEQLAPGRARLQSLGPARRDDRHLRQRARPAGAG